MSGLAAASLRAYHPKIKVPLAAIIFGELSEVTFDDFAVVRRKFFSKALKSLLALGGWQISPAGAVADFLLIDVAWAFATGDLTVIHRLRLRLILLTLTLLLLLL